MLAAGVGLAVLASEYPEKFEDVRGLLPDYFQGVMRILETVSQAGQRTAQMTDRRGANAWDRIESY